MLAHLPAVILHGVGNLEPPASALGAARQAAVPSDGRCGGIRRDMRRKDSVPRAGGGGPRRAGDAQLKVGAALDELDLDARE